MILELCIAEFARNH